MRLVQLVRSVERLVFFLCLAVVPVYTLLYTPSMSQSRELDEDTDMAISYASRSPAGHSQQLPSFREVSPRYGQYSARTPKILTPDRFSRLICTTTSIHPLTITRGPNHRSALDLAMRWPILAPFLVIQRAGHLNLPTNTTTNTLLAPANTHPGRWEIICRCGSAKAPHEDPVLFFPRSETWAPCQTERVTQTAGWRHAPIPMHTTIVLVSPLPCLHRW